MQERPFWEQLYADMEVSTFSKSPTMDVNEFYNVFPKNAQVLDVGCGEGRNSIFMAKLGNKVDVILSHGVLHLPYKDVRDKFITKMQGNTKI